MSQLRFARRADLVAALEARRPWAVAYDKRTLMKHKAEEMAALMKFRATCREFGKRNLADLKVAIEGDGKPRSQRAIYDLFDFELPSCPASAVVKLDEVLALLTVTKQESFTLTGGYKDPVSGAFWLLTHDDAKPKATVC